MRVVVFRCLSVISVLVYLETSKPNGGGGSFVTAEKTGQQGGVTKYNIDEIYGEDLMKELEPEGWQEYGARKWAKGREKVGGYANTGLKWIRNNDKVKKVLNSNVVQTVKGYGYQAAEKTKEGLNRILPSSDDESSGQEEERGRKRKRRHDDRDKHRDHGKNRDDGKHQDDGKHRDDGKHQDHGNHRHHHHHHHHHHKEEKMKPKDYQGACVKHCANIYGFLFESYSEDGVPRFSAGAVYPITRGKAELKEYIKENTQERSSTYECECKPTSDFELMVKTAYPEVPDLLANFKKQQVSDPLGATFSVGRIFKKMNWDWKELQEKQGIKKKFDRYFHTNHERLLQLIFQEMIQYSEIPAKAQASQTTEEAKQKERAAHHRQDPSPRAGRAKTRGAAQGQ